MLDDRVHEICACGTLFVPVQEGARECPICFDFRRASGQVRMAIAFQARFQPEIAKSAAVQLNALVKKFQGSIKSCGPNRERRSIPMEIRFVEIQMLARVVNKLLGIGDVDNPESRWRRAMSLSRELLEEAESRTMSFHDIRQRVYAFQRELRGEIRIAAEKAAKIAKKAEKSAAASAPTVSLPKAAPKKRAAAKSKAVKSAKKKS